MKLYSACFPACFTRERQAFKLLNKNGGEEGGAEGRGREGGGGGRGGRQQMAGRLHEEWDVLAPQLATSEHPAQNTTDAAELVQRSVVFAGDLFFQSATCENWL